eukprot:757379-Hanusia_phi.AAC.12
MTTSCGEVGSAALRQQDRKTRKTDAARRGGMRRGRDRRGGGVGVSYLQVILGAVVLELDMKAIFDANLHLDAVVDLRLRNFRNGSQHRKFPPAGRTRANRKSMEGQESQSRLLQTGSTNSISNKNQTRQGTGAGAGAGADTNPPCHHLTYHCLNILDPHILLEHYIGAAKKIQPQMRSRAGEPRKESPVLPGDSNTKKISQLHIDPIVTIVLDKHVSLHKHQRTTNTIIAM